MESSEDKSIRELLISDYAEVIPPQELKGKIMNAIELMKTLKELSLLYTKAPLHVLEQMQKGGKEL